MIELSSERSIISMWAREEGNFHWSNHSHMDFSSCISRFLTMVKGFWFKPLVLWIRDMLKISGSLS